MTSENRELSVEELGSVAGGGLVDNVLPETEASTAEFLKRFGEGALRFNAFISSATNQGPAVANQG
ncbi:hypothetical protein [Bradyrhizobium sp. JYMT SZCCT0180]|uniref:hypothetical protein n=1 Tax=Bradyrhizobium sp. JYMT SZCCT0180 TaxID=2807666 RepID=UPI001BAA14CA|nr:hypothetical protein [Bradyrhizobium sp. JYMT SZCCT0180]MBR1211964.1 hypothetical protein [Bradyrhizobium sp. JYMT SZCCT0180]